MRKWQRRAYICSDMHNRTVTYWWQLSAINGHILLLIGVWAKATSVIGFKLVINGASSSSHPSTQGLDPSLMASQPSMAKKMQILLTHRLWRLGQPYFKFNYNLDSTIRLFSSLGGYRYPFYLNVRDSIWLMIKTLVSHLLYNTFW